MVITLLIENDDSLPPDQEELELWATTYGQSFPVLSDTEPVALRYTERGTLSLPSHSLIGPGAEVLIADGDVTEDDIVEALP